jgi:nucleolar protein 53
MPASTKTASKTSKPAIKPYDRPSKDHSLKSTGINIGAPAQPGQKSRKGKRAWRKNVDITLEEQALEQAREEERITG